MARVAEAVTPAERGLADEGINDESTEKKDGKEYERRESFQIAT
jgi:hypothetical protein